MKFIKKNTYLLSFFFVIVWSFLTGCTTETKGRNDDAIGIYHYNITIAPDLSNRTNINLYPKPVQDHKIISTILNLINETLHEGNRETNQKDSYSISFINQGVIRMYEINQSLLNIDFSGFPNQFERINFIMNQDNYTSNGLKEATDKFNKECIRIYSKTAGNTDGADIWSFLEDRINNIQVKESEAPFEYSGSYFQNRYRNILILLTDGYIETGLSQSSPIGKNQSYDLSQLRINKFRDDFKKSGESDMAKFFRDNNYGIVPLTNKNLENLEVLVLEMYDRSLDRAGNARVHPTDADIMKLFWEDWFEKSKITHREFHTCFSNEREAKLTIQNFLKARVIN